VTAAVYSVRWASSRSRAARSAPGPAALGEASLRIAKYWQLGPIRQTPPAAPRPGPRGILRAPEVSRVRGEGRCRALRTSADSSPTAFTARSGILIDVNSWEEPPAGRASKARQVARAVAEREQGRRRLNATTVTVSLSRAWRWPAPSPPSSRELATRPRRPRAAARRPAPAPARARARRARPVTPTGQAAARQVTRTGSSSLPAPRSPGAAVVSAPPPAVLDPTSGRRDHPLVGVDGGHGHGRSR
jgi:hypothetical protein